MNQYYYKISLKILICSLWAVNTLLAQENKFGGEDILTTQLGDACRNGDLKSVKNIIMKTKLIPENKKYINTALSLGTLYSRSEIVKWLVEHGANINFIDNNGRHVVLQDITDPLLLEYLISNGLSLDWKDKYGRSAIHFSVLPLHDKILQALITKGTDINQKTINGQSPLFIAALNGASSAIKLLLHNKANVNIRTNSGETPLHAAAARGNIQDVSLLLWHGAIPNSKDIAGNTPVHYAAQMNHSDIIRLFKLCGANLETSDNLGNTPLHRSRQYNSSDAEKALIQYAIFPWTKNIYGQTYLNIPTAWR